MENYVVVYSTTHCMRCKMVKRWLDEHSVKYNEINLDLPEWKDERNHLSLLGYRSVPITKVQTYNELIYIDGFNPSELNKHLGGK